MTHDTPLNAHINRLVKSLSEAISFLDQCNHLYAGITIDATGLRVQSAPNSTLSAHEQVYLAVFTHAASDALAGLQQAWDAATERHPESRFDLSIGCDLPQSRPAKPQVSLTFLKDDKLIHKQTFHFANFDPETTLPCDGIKRYLTRLLLVLDALPTADTPRWWTYENGHSKIVCAKDAPSGLLLYSALFYVDLFDEILTQHDAWPHHIHEVHTVTLNDTRPLLAKLRLLRKT